MDVHLPPGATCYALDHSSYPPSVAACVPSEGLIILDNSRVVAWCDIGDDDVKSIAILFTYYPFCKHYVLQFSSIVKVVSHQISLKVTHTFENISKFEIRDFTNRGYPQLGLWKETALTPCITDLTMSSSSQSSNPVERILSSKLKGLKLGVKKAEVELEDRRRLRKYCMFRILGSNLCEKFLPSKNLFDLLGSLSDEGVETRSSENLIKISNTWQRVFHGKWILGCDVHNASQSPLRSLSLYGVGGSDRVEWRLMAPQRVAGGPRWTTLPPDGALQPGQRAILLAEVPEPSFSSRSPFAEMRAVLIASLPDGRETWSSVPPWRLSAAALLRAELLPLAPGQEESAEEVLALQTCSPVRLALHLQGRVGLIERVERLLADVQLRTPRWPSTPRGGGGGLVGPPRLLVGMAAPGTPLHAAVAELRVTSSTACWLRVHVRERRHALALVHLLRGGLPGHTRIRAAAAARFDDAEGEDDEDADADRDWLKRRLVLALEAELQALAHDAALTRAKLHPLELATDRAARGLRARLARVTLATA